LSIGKLCAGDTGDAGDAGDACDAGDAGDANDAGFGRGGEDDAPDRGPPLKLCSLRQKSHVTRSGCAWASTTITVWMRSS